MSEKDLACLIENKNSQNTQKNLNDRTIIELGCRKISRFFSVLRARNYLPMPKADHDNSITIIRSTSSNNCLLFVDQEDVGKIYFKKDTVKPYFFPIVQLKKLIKRNTQTAVFFYAQQHFKSLTIYRLIHYFYYYPHPQGKKPREVDGSFQANYILFIDRRFKNYFVEF